MYCCSRNENAYGVTSREYLDIVRDVNGLTFLVFRIRDAMLSLSTRKDVSIEKNPSMKLSRELNFLMTDFNFPFILSNRLLVEFSKLPFIDFSL